ncbi:MAG: hypothetical protein ABSA52_23955 [Candidatus Binatia bacterium]
MLILLGAMALWRVIDAPYGRLVAAGGIQVLHLIESPHVTDTVHVVGGYALVSRTEAYKDVADQWLELRTHHHNVPLLVALILAGPGIARSRRVRSLLIGLSLLSLTHVLDFVLAVHWHYAFHNVGPYRVTDLKYLNRGLWESLDNPVQVAKLLILDFGTFYREVGRLLMPILLWMILCRDTFTVIRPTVPQHDE